MLFRPVPLSVPGAGLAKAFGLIQQLGLGLAHSGFESTCTGRSFAAVAVQGYVGGEVGRNPVRRLEAVNRRDFPVRQKTRSPSDWRTSEL